MIVLITLPHTGTIFTRTFLSSCPGVAGHLGINQLGEKPPEGTHVLWGHFSPDEWGIQAPWCRSHRFVMPMRDPLSTAVSHHKRSSDMDAENWARASSVVDALCPHYLPLDLLLTEEQRTEALKQTCRSVGLSPKTCIDHCRLWARHWALNLDNKAISNTAGPSTASAAYIAGDIATLTELMPEKIAALKLHERSLRPWMERIGYRNLLWWS